MGIISLSGVEIKLPSNRSFGLVFALIFFIIAIFILAFKKAEIYYLYTESAAFDIGNENLFLIFLGTTFLLASLLFFITAVIFPKRLHLLNYIWYKFGILLGKVISPIVLFILFYILITPISLFLKIIGRDELRLMRNPIDTYWIKRESKKIFSFKNQF